MRRGFKNRIPPDDDGQMNLQPIIPIGDFEMFAEGLDHPEGLAFFRDVRNFCRTIASLCSSSLAP